MATLSFQSQVVAGFVGNSAARLAFALLGQPLWEVPTVLLSNHPAGRSATGETLDAHRLERLVAGLFDNGLAGQIGFVLSGYLGHHGQAEVIARTLDRLSAEGRFVGYVLDPVIGDRAAGAYVGEGIESAMRDALLPRARLVTPNHFELERLAGQPAPDDAAVWRNAKALQSVGPTTVIVTSVATAETPPQAVRTFLLSGDQRWVIETPRVDTPAYGAGDLTTAALVARLAAGDAIELALARAVSGVYGILVATGNSPDLAAAEASREIANPTTAFAVTAMPPLS